MCVQEDNTSKMMIKTRVVKKVTEVIEVILVVNDTNDCDTEREWMKYEKNRLDSFDPIWLEYYHFGVTFAEHLAKAGFYCVTDGDSVCFSCGLRKSSFFWKVGHNPETIHREECQNCKFVIGQSDNVPFGSVQLSNREFVIAADDDTRVADSNLPKHPEYELESERLSTFRTWGVQSPEILSKAGFYYTGERDAVRCFHCDGCLSNWEHAHNPFNEHARWYPNCGFIRSIKLENEGVIYQQNAASLDVVPGTVNVKPTVPVDAETLKKLREAAEETERKLREVERKLQVLMQVVNSCCGERHHLHPHPTLSNATSASQQMISTERNQSSHTSPGSLYVEEISSQQIKPLPSPLQRADETATGHYKILQEVASIITEWDELDTLGIWLGFKYKDVSRLRNANHSIKNAAYQILCSFYELVPNNERWRILIEALKELGKHSTIVDLGLEVHQKAQSCG